MPPLPRPARGVRARPTLARAGRAALLTALLLCTGPLTTPALDRSAPMPVLPSASALVGAFGQLAAQVQGEPQPFQLDDAFRYRTTSLQALSPDGRWALVGSIGLEDRLGIDNYRFGDPTYTAPVRSHLVLVDLSTGEEREAFSGPVQLQRATWSPDGRHLAALVRSAPGPEALPDPDSPFQVHILEAPDSPGGAVDSRIIPIPGNRLLTGDAQLHWEPDGSRLLFDARTLGWAEEARERFRHEVHGPIVVRSSEDPFLSWEEVRRYGLRRAILAWDPSGGAVTEVRDDEPLGSWFPLPGGELRVHLDITEATDYDRILGRDDRILMESADEEDARVLISNDRGLSLRWSGDGTAWAWSAEGELRFQTVEMDEPRVLAGGEAPQEPEGDVPPEAATEEEAPGAGEDDEPRLTPERLNHDGSLLLARAETGYWTIDTSTGRRTRLLELDPDDDEAPGWSVAAWDRSSRDLYLLESSRTRWEWALHRFDAGSGSRVELTRGDSRIAGVEISDDGAVVVFTYIAPGQPPRLMVTDREFREVRELGSDPNPWLAQRALGEVELMRYLDVDGEELFGILHLPPGFQDDRRYPTVFILYETFFNPSFDTQARLLNAHGYVVVQPSVNLVQGRPGEGWLKGVTAAANQLIERGITDPERMGIQGVSYGGYAVNLLVAQTPRFAAAINISGKTNMVSFYTDSPRLGTRNTHAPERSQDRIGGTLWEMPQQYLDHSAVMVADRIHTPLLLLTGQQDHNVTERTTSEMFYALRRLGRTVEWVSYIDGGHGIPRSTRAEAEDYLNRILDWYERHMPEPTAPSADADASSEAATQTLLPN